MMKLLIVASAASAWSLGVPKGLPKTPTRALQQQRQQNQVIAAAPASTTALKATEVTGGAKAEDGLMETLKTGSFFALWYLFNIGYNIYNKKALNAMAIPWTMALLQLFVGIPYVAALWATGLRKAPKLTTDNIKTLVPVSLGHLGTHIGAVISLGAGAVSFTHIIKASEPVVSAGLSAVMLGAVYSPITYATLLPIVGGVALASLKELSFTWLGFWAAILSNVSSALRAILAKKTMNKGVGENMTEANLYAVLTILATIFLLPVSLLIETPATIMAAINGALAGGATSGYLWTARRMRFGAQFGATRSAQFPDASAYPSPIRCRSSPAPSTTCTTRSRSSPSAASTR